MPRTYQTEFPDYPESDMPRIPADWADVSWRNEPCPQFFTGEGLSVFVDFTDPAAREFPDTPRFSISARPEAGEWRDLFASDDWAEVLAYLASYEASARGGELPESVYEAFREGRATVLESCRHDLSAVDPNGDEVCSDCGATAAPNG